MTINTYCMTISGSDDMFFFVFFQPCFFTLETFESPELGQRSAGEIPAIAYNFPNAAGHCFGVLKQVWSMFFFLVNVYITMEHHHVSGENSL